MKQPMDYDEFLIDIKHGYHYHRKGCPGATCPISPDCYTAHLYMEIRKLKNRSGRKFEPCPACFQMEKQP